MDILSLKRNIVVSWTKIYLNFYILHRHSRKPWAKFMNGDNHHLAVPEVKIFDIVVEIYFSSFVCFNNF